MKNTIIHQVIFIVALFIFASGCKASKKHSYINSDASALFSTNPARPFKYGYAYDRKTCEKYFKDRIVGFGIRNGDVIADVGAASGWLDGIYSVLVDSVTFYVQDIDTNYLDQKQLDAVIDHYSNQRLSPQTNKFHMIMGNTERTNLPDSTFDKIIICNTLHEITDPDPLITDLSSKIKSGGKVIIFDQFSSPYKKIKHSGCGIEGSLVSDVINKFNEHGFYLTSMKDPPNSSLNFLTFEKDESKAIEFSDRTKKIEGYLAPLDRLNQKKTSGDSSACASIGSELKSHLNEIHSVFPSLTSYLDHLAELWSEEKCHANAINVMRVRVTLYPQEAESYSNMGFVLEEGKKYSEALNWHTRAIEMDQKNPDYFSGRGDALVKLKRYEESIKDYAMAISLDSVEAEYHFNLGYAYEQIGEYWDAITHYSDAIRLDPYEHEYLWYRGYVLLNGDDLEPAIKDFSKAIELDPTNWSYYKARARAKKYMGDENGYKEDMKKAKEMRSKRH